VAPDTQKILLERARHLARKAEPEETGVATIEVVEFRLAQERYAVETRHVAEVHPLKELTLVPCTPPFVVGIVNVRGHIVTVLDLKSFLNLPSQGLTDLHCVILVRMDDFEVGLLADVITGVRLIPIDKLQPSLPTLSAATNDCLRGVTPDAVTVLDLERMLADPRLIVHEEVHV
jgi:purine-binding chemotaxis protein CheW